jgi:hypothetical protein
MARHLTSLLIAFFIATAGALYLLLGALKPGWYTWILLAQVAGSFLSALLVVAHRQHFALYDAVTAVVDKLQADAPWDEVSPELERVKKSTLTTNATGFLRMLNLAVPILLVATLVVDFLSIQDFLLFLIPGIYACTLIAIVALFRNGNELLSTLESWVGTAMTEIEGELAGLNNYRLAGTEKHFDAIDDLTGELRVIGGKFRSELKRLAKVPGLSNLQISREIFAPLHEVVSEIYRCRGNIAGLMSLLLKLKDIQLKNQRNLESGERRQFYDQVLQSAGAATHALQDKMAEVSGTLEKQSAETVNKIDAKAKSTHDALNGKAAESIAVVVAKHANLDQAWNQKIKDFDAKIETVYDKNYAKFGQLHKQLGDAFTQLDKEVKDSIGKLKEQAAKVFVERLLEESMKANLGKDFFGSFAVLLDLYLGEAMQVASADQKKGLLLELCTIQEMLAKPRK